MVDVVVPGYSNVRWYAWAEILFVIATAGMRLLGDFITECEHLDYGDASTKALRKIYDEKPDKLRLELAAMLDMRILVSTTYALEGDRLELLLVFSRIEALRAFGRAIKAEEDGVLPNVDAVLRRVMKLKAGVKIEKHYDGHGLCVAKLVKEVTLESTLYPGQQRKAWEVKYESDGLVEHFEEEELRSGKHGAAPAGEDGKPVLIVRDLPERKAICEALVPGFDYLEARITGTCEAQYSLVEMYELCRVVRAFDPSFAKDHVDAAFVNTMSAITPLHSLGMLDNLKQQLPQYVAEATASSPAFNAASVADYSEAVLDWWRTKGRMFPAWALAARIVFAISPNSASCERVFALGQTSMADVWDTKDWGDRHFAEGLGFWEVNVFKALVYFHPDYKKLTHPRFRRLLAHAMLTLGKVPFGEAEPEPEARPAHSCCTLKRFTSYTNEKHQCGYCQQKSYFYCATCFPEEKKAEYAICNPCSSDKPCFHRHIIGEKPTHKMQHIKKKKKAAEPTRASPRRASQARTGPGADPGVGGARRRIDPDA